MESLKTTENREQALKRLLDLKKKIFHPVREENIQIIDLLAFFNALMEGAKKFDIKLRDVDDLRKPDIQYFIGVLENKILLNVQE